MINNMPEHKVYVTSVANGRARGWKVLDAGVDKQGLHGKFHVIAERDAARFNAMKGGEYYFPSGKYIVVKADSTWQVNLDPSVQSLLPRSVVQDMVVKERDRGRSRRNTGIMVAVIIAPILVLGVAMATFSGTMRWGA